MVGKQSIGELRNPWLVIPGRQRFHSGDLLKHGASSRSSARTCGPPARCSLLPDARNVFRPWCAAETHVKACQCECEICVVKLRERWGRAPRDRLSGAGPKPLQAAAVKSRGGERWSESSRKTLGR